MNDLTKLLNIEYPLIQGGMGNISHAALASAVSNAGGLGTIGAGTLEPDTVEKMLQDSRSQTKMPFAVNLPLAVQPYIEEIIDLIVKYDVPVVTLSAGNPSPYIQHFKDNNVVVMCVVANDKQAKKAEDSGADVIIAEGYEAAGINSAEELTTFTLIPKISSCVQVPVVAAGGIGNGQGVAAAMSLGAQGVQLGTRLIATKEAQVHTAYKEAICEAGSDGTIIVGRTYNRIRRILKTPYSDQILQFEKEKQPVDVYLKKTNEIHHRIGAIEGKLSKGHVNAGQISSLIEDIPSVEVLFNRMMFEARESLETNLSMFN